MLKCGLAYNIALSKLTPGTPNFFDQGMLTQGKGSVQLTSLISQLVLLKRLKSFISIKVAILNVAVLIKLVQGPRMSTVLSLSA